jgi:hypothetical protein
MARLQILELPSGVGDERPPFLLVIDQASEQFVTEVAANSKDIAEAVGARAVCVFEETVEIPANDTSGYLAEAQEDSTPIGPDFTSPIAGCIEVRDPCPWCGDRQMIPRWQMDEHVARLHPDVTTGGRVASDA